MYTRKFRTGIAPVDRSIDEIYEILNRQKGVGGASTSVSTSYPITTEGGFYITGINGMPYQLEKGVLVKVSSSADSTFLIAEEDDYNISGVVYENTPTGENCKVVFTGPADVYFNSLGATREHYLRMSKVADTAAVDTGVASSESINRIDIIRLLGWVFESRTGAGLARCILKR